MASSSFIASSPTIYTYFISSHGQVVTVINPKLYGKDVDEKRAHLQSQYSVSDRTFISLDLPKNIELLTYTSLGERIRGHCQTVNFVCNKKKKNLYAVDTPVYKYKQEFPELYLTNEKPKSEVGQIPRLIFYSGIVHCIPEGREDSSKKKEIIHNIDANPLKDCGDDSIFPYYDDSDGYWQLETPITERRYDSTNKYNKDYITVLGKKNGNFRDFPLDSIKKCGPLLLSDAIKIIVQHCYTTYSTNYLKSIIQIHLDLCLVVSNKYFIPYKTNDKSVNNLEYFNAFLSNIDPIIKDTLHTRNYVYTFGERVFTIAFPKKESFRYDNDETYEKVMYYDFLEHAMYSLPKEIIDFLPNEILIYIPKAHSMEEKDIKKYISHEINKLIMHPDRNKRKSRKEVSYVSQSRKKSKKDSTEEKSESLVLCPNDEKNLSNNDRMCIIQGGKKIFARTKRFKKRMQRRQTMQRTRRMRRRQTRHRHKRLIV